VGGGRRERCAVRGAKKKKGKREGSGCSGRGLISRGGFRDPPWHPLTPSPSHAISLTLTRTTPHPHPLTLTASSIFASVSSVSPIRNSRCAAETFGPPPHGSYILHGTPSLPLSLPPSLFLPLSPLLPTSSSSHSSSLLISLPPPSTLVRVYHHVHPKCLREKRQQRG